MKRLKYFLLSIICIVCLSAKGQIGDARNQLSVGGSLGVALNTVDFDPTIKQKMHVAPTLGVALKYTSEKYFTTFCSLYAEANYTQLGWTEDIMDENSQPLPDTYRRNLHYLQIPIFARLSWGRETKGFQFFFQAGPQFGICLGEGSSKSSTWTVDADGNPNRPNKVYAQYGLDVEHKFDYGIAAGLGAELTNDLGHFIVEGRYYYGLGDMYGNSKKDPFSRSANTTIFVKLAYLFDLKK